ncbi:MAG TPA: hypothetical protein PKN33_20070 [Phycisphaerae bacterium]|nr:hypothetical protein [Phycisphaerae bacterium]
MRRDVTGIGWAIGDSGYKVDYREDHQDKQTRVRLLRDAHMYTYSESDQPTELLFRHQDGTIVRHDLPSANLSSGIVPHVLTRKKRSPTISLIITLGAMGAVLGLVWIGAELGLAEHLQQIQADMAHSTAKRNGIRILILATGILCYGYAPLAAAMLVFPRVRAEVIMRDGPFCSKCLGDLTGVKADTCPACGNAINLPPAVVCTILNKG